MALGTYDGLKSAIADHLEETGLDAQIDDFIDLAESQHRAEIRIRGLLARAQLGLTKRFAKLPEGFLDARHIRLLTTPKVTPIREVSPSEMDRMRRETSGLPRFVTIHEELEFDVVPDETYTVEMMFYKRATPLSTENPTNAILDISPGLYLYAALAFSAPFLINDERIQTWVSFYTSIRDSIVAADRRGLNIGPLFSRVAGPTP